VTKSRGRASACGDEEAEARLEDARQFLMAAEMFLDESPDVATSNAVLAGIAATDALCCTKLRERAADDDHRRAVERLQTFDATSANRLSRLLAMKTKAQYSSAKVSSRDAGRAVRWAQQLVASAEDTMTDR
jgi:hypothetical protein